MLEAEGRAFFADRGHGARQRQSDRERGQAEGRRSERNHQALRVQGLRCAHVRAHRQHRTSAVWRRLLSYRIVTEEPGARGYRMDSYVTQELPKVVAANFPIDPSRAGIFGHSMGGHGALTIALRNPDTYASVSAFAPICSPMRCPWGAKALAGYLGADRARWRQYDTTALLEDLGWSG